MQIQCPHCSNPIQVVDEHARSEILCAACGGAFRLGGERTPTYVGPSQRAPHGWVLRRLEPEGIAASYVLEPPGPIVLGRSASCALRINDARVSRRHCVLNFTDDR
jgi:hypothetical protein